MMMVSERETTPALYLVFRPEYLLLQHPVPIKLALARSFFHWFPPNFPVTSFVHRLFFPPFSHFFLAWVLLFMSSKLCSTNISVQHPAGAGRLTRVHFNFISQTRFSRNPHCHYQLWTSNPPMVRFLDQGRRHDSSILFSRP
jgi:hypothetical protein